MVDMTNFEMVVKLFKTNREALEYLKDINIPMSYPTLNKRISQGTEFSTEEWNNYLFSFSIHSSKDSVIKHKEHITKLFHMFVDFGIKGMIDADVYLVKELCDAVWAEVDEDGATDSKFVTDLVEGETADDPVVDDFNLDVEDEPEKESDDFDLGLESEPIADEPDDFAEFDLRLEPETPKAEPAKEIIAQLTKEPEPEKEKTDEKPKSVLDAVFGVDTGDDKSKKRVSTVASDEFEKDIFDIEDRYDGDLEDTRD